MPDIKVAGKLAKLDPKDDYDLVDGNDVTGFAELKADVADKVDHITISGSSAGSVPVDARAIKFVGGNILVGQGSDGTAEVVIMSDTPNNPYTLGLAFAGIYQDLQALKDAIPTPHANMQAIVLSPSEKYYHSVGDSWVELAPVGSLHDKYLGVYDTVMDIIKANPNPEDNSIAIVGTTSKAFYLYQNSKWAEISTTNVAQLELTVKDNTKRIDIAEGHLQTIQADKLESVTVTGGASGSVPIKAKTISFTGSNVLVGDGGDGVAEVVITGSGDSGLGDRVTQLEGEITFLDKKVDDLPKGIKMSDGIGASHEVTEITIKGASLSGSGTVVDIPVEYRHFTSIPERDAWATKYGSVVGDTVVSVDTLGGKLLWFKYDRYADSWHEYTRDGLTVTQTEGAARATDVTSLGLVHPLQLDVPQGVLEDNDGTATLQIDPTAFQHQSGVSASLLTTSVLRLKEEAVSTLYFDHEIVPLAPHFSTNVAAKGINLKGNDDGLLTHIMVSVGFYGDIQFEGTVRLWVEEGNTNSGFENPLLDLNGNLMEVSRHFNKGDNLGSGLLLTGAVSLKQDTVITIKVSTPAGQVFVVDPSKTLLCVQQYADGYETSLACMEFERILGVDIRNALRTFGASEMSITDSLMESPHSLAVVPAGSGWEHINGLGINNLTDVMASIRNGVFSISANGKPIDYYIYTVLDSVSTRMLRGQSISYKVTAVSPDTDMILECYSWVGAGDQVEDVYTQRDGSNNVLVNTGFKSIKDKVISFNPSQVFSDYADQVEVPEDANNIIIMVRPATKTDPSTFELKEFSWGMVNSPFHGYAELRRTNLNEYHLVHDLNYAEFSLAEGDSTLSGASGRYNIHDTPATGGYIPVGMLSKGKAPVQIDHSVNVVSDPQPFEGAMKFLEDGTAKIQKTYLVRNGDTVDNTVTFWDVLIDPTGKETKLPDSEKTFTIPKNSTSPGVFVSIPEYTVDLKNGDRIGGRALANKKDAIYLETDYPAQPIVQIKLHFDGFKDEQFLDDDILPTVYSRKARSERLVIPFTGSSAAVYTVSLTIPNDVTLGSCSVAHVDKGSKIIENSVEVAIHSDTVDVHVGTATEGEIYMELWQ